MNTVWMRTPPSWTRVVFPGNELIARKTWTSPWVLLSQISPIKPLKTRHRQSHHKLMTTRLHSKSLLLTKVPDPQESFSSGLQGWKTTAFWFHDSSLAPESLKGRHSLSSALMSQSLNSSSCSETASAQSWSLQRYTTLLWASKRLWSMGWEAWPTSSSSWLKSERKAPSSYNYWACQANRSWALMQPASCSTAKKPSLTCKMMQKRKLKMAKRSSSRK